MKAAATLLIVAFSAACASAPPGKASPRAAARAGYDAPPAAPHGIDVQIDARAANEILESLARPRLDPQDARILEDLPAVRLAIQDSTRSNDIFEQDFAAAFEEKARPSVFDFRTIRQERDRWRIVLDAVVSREKDLVRLASRHAAALLPGDRAVTARVRVFLSFGLAGLADHLVLPSTEGEDRMVVDLARALGESQGEPLESLVSRLARLVGGEAFRQAWAIYRRDNPAWGRPQPQTAPIDLLMRAVAEAGPAAVFSVEESFFPLSVWLKDPMKRSIDELNRRSERFVQAQENLDSRVELTTELRRPEFQRQLAGPAGAFLTDAIIQTSGLEALRTALQNGPKAFFQAYDRACQTDKSLIPLSHVLRDRLK
jgi:hypothetical protein